MTAQAHLMYILNIVHLLFLGIGFLYLNMLCCATFCLKSSITKNNILARYVCFYIVCAFFLDRWWDRTVSFIQYKNLSVHTNKKPIRWHLSIRFNISRFLSLFSTFFKYFMFNVSCFQCTCHDVITVVKILVLICTYLSIYYAFFLFIEADVKRFHSFF